MLKGVIYIQQAAVKPALHVHAQEHGMHYAIGPLGSS